MTNKQNTYLDISVPYIFVTHLNLTCRFLHNRKKKLTSSITSVQTSESSVFGLLKFGPCLVLKKFIKIFRFSVTSNLYTYT